MFTAAFPLGPSSAHRLATFVVACSAFIGLATHAQQTPSLTLDQALQTAQDRSRQLPAHDAAASASRERAIAAGQRPDPTLSVGLNNLPVSGPDRLSLTRDFMTMRSVGVMQEFTRSDKLTARSARYDREAEAAQEGDATLGKQIAEVAAIDRIGSPGQCRDEPCDHAATFACADRTCA